MAFCNQCGQGVGDRDAYCGKCGTRQASAPPPPFPNVSPLGISDKAAGMLCYIPFMGWIGAIMILATDYYRQKDRVRFHAFQGLYLFGAWLLVDHVFGPMLHFTPLFPARFAEGLAKLAVVCCWIFMLVRSNNGEDYHLPVVGDLAERSVSEQR